VGGCCVQGMGKEKEEERALKLLRYAMRQYGSYSEAAGGRKDVRKSVQWFLKKSRGVVNRRNDIDFMCRQGLKVLRGAR